MNFIKIITTIPVSYTHLIENRVENYFICPEGEKLFLKNYRKINGRLHKIYSTTKCKQCPKLKKCTSSRVKEITEVADPYNCLLYTSNETTALRTINNDTKILLFIFIFNFSP